MLSLCLTNYNRYEMLLESFQHVYDDERISEIVISDDCSNPDIYKKIQDFCKHKSKIKLYRQEFNVGMGANKAWSVALAKNEWCILFDSDNVIKSDYIDAFYKWSCLDFPKMYIFCPVKAAPQFDYSKFKSRHINKHEAKRSMKEPLFDCLLNTCNYVVNRDEYLHIFRHRPDIKASDTIHFNYLWLKAGGSFYVVPEMQYFHRVHKNSGFLADYNYNLRQAEETKRMIMQL